MVPLKVLSPHQMGGCKVAARLDFEDVSDLLTCQEQKVSIERVRQKKVWAEAEVKPRWNPQDFTEHVQHPIAPSCSPSNRQHKGLRSQQELSPCV